MGEPQSKQKAFTAVDEVGTKGEFKRTDSTYRNTIAPGTRFEPEAGRYHLYVSLACPWAHGTLAALKHKGLDKVIGVSIAHPTWQRTRPSDPDDTHAGWVFRSPGDAPVTSQLGFGEFECDEWLVPDVVNGCSSVRDVYEQAGDRVGKYTTPLLYCTKEGAIVSNESTDILRMLDSAFDSFAEHPERTLFPAQTQAEAEELNAFIYPTVNNGVYRCGFARSQQAYAKAHSELFDSLDRLEARLAASGARFLTGEEFTWIDLRLFMTLVRFDPVYITYFKTSEKRIVDFPHLLAFTRACYAVPAVRDTTSIRHIKMHYFTSHPTLNHYAIIPEYDGPALELSKEALVPGG